MGALTFAISSGSARSSSMCFGQPPTVLGGDGDEDFVGTEAVDVILAGAGSDSIHGLGGDDLLGYGGRDLIVGGPGNHDLNGGRGRDRLRGERGNDTLTGENPPVHPDVRDDCRGGPGRDRQYFC
jgi:Ca2+-binding RTX toxin-like protein